MPAIPPWKYRIETSWPLCPVCIERTTQMSSTMPGGRREQLRDLGAALAPLRELPGRAEELLVRPVDEAINHVAAVLGPVVFGQLGLGVEQVDVRRPAVHEHRDHRRRLRGEVRGLRLEVHRQVLARLPGRLGQQPLLAQQVHQGERPDPEGGVRQEGTTARVRRINPHRETRWRSGVVDRGR